MLDSVVEAYRNVFESPSGEEVRADLATVYLLRSDPRADLELTALGYRGAELAAARDAQRMVVARIMAILDDPEGHKDGRERPDAG